LEIKIKIKKNLELKIIHSRIGDPEERLLCSRNENLKKKMKSFILNKKIHNTKNSFPKKIQNTYSGKMSLEIFLYAPHFF